MFKNVSFCVFQGEIHQYHSENGGNAEELVPKCKTPEPACFRPDRGSCSDQETEGKVLKKAELLCKNALVRQACCQEPEVKEGLKHLLLFNHKSGAGKRGLKLFIAAVTYHCRLRFTKNNDKGEKVILEEGP